jgi:hypothetical protein
MITARTQKDVDETAEECRQLGVKVGSFAANGIILSDLENLVKQVQLQRIPLMVDGTTTRSGRYPRVQRVYPHQ